MSFVFTVGREACTLGHGQTDGRRVGPTIGPCKHTADRRLLARSTKIVWTLINLKLNRLGYK